MLPRSNAEYWYTAQDGAGWQAILLTWFYSLLWWSLADIAKVLVQKVSQEL